MENNPGYIMMELEKLLKQQEELDKKIKSAMKKERDEALKTVKELCQRHGFTENMLKNYLGAGRKRKAKAG
jgi:DNA-binding protein H-NS